MANRSETGQPGRLKPPIIAHPAFPAVVALWFAVLLGAGSFIVPVALFEGIISALGVDGLVSAAAPPLGATARLLIALAAAGIGAITGLAIARRVATAMEHRESDQAVASAVLDDYVSTRLRKEEVEDDETLLFGSFEDEEDDLPPRDMPGDPPVFEVPEELAAERIGTPEEESRDTLASRLGSDFDHVEGGEEIEPGPEVDFPDEHVDVAEDEARPEPAETFAAEADPAEEAGASVEAPRTDWTTVTFHSVEDVERFEDASLDHEESVEPSHEAEQSFDPEPELESESEFAPETEIQTEPETGEFLPADAGDEPAPSLADLALRLQDAMRRHREWRGTQVVETLPQPVGEPYEFLATGETGHAEETETAFDGPVEADFSESLQGASSVVGPAPLVEDEYSEVPDEIEPVASFAEGPGPGGEISADDYAAPEPEPAFEPEIEVGPELVAEPEPGEAAAPSYDDWDEPDDEERDWFSEPDPVLSDLPVDEGEMPLAAMPEGLVATKGHAELPRPFLDLDFPEAEEEEFADEDLAASFTLPIPRGDAPKVTFSGMADDFLDDLGDEDEGEEETDENVYGSLLSMRGPYSSGAAEHGEEDPSEWDDGALEDEHDEDYFEDLPTEPAQESAPSGGPAPAPTPVAPISREEQDAALRDALLNLQRMSGAA